MKRGAGGRIMGSVKRSYEVGAEHQSGIPFARVSTTTGKKKQMATLRGISYQTPSGRGKDISMKIPRGYAATLLRKARKAGPVRTITNRG